MCLGGGQPGSSQRAVQLVSVKQKLIITIELFPKHKLLRFYYSGYYYCFSKTSQTLSRPTPSSLPFLSAPSLSSPFLLQIFPPPNLCIQDLGVLLLCVVVHHANRSRPPCKACHLHQSACSDGLIPVPSKAFPWIPLSELSNFKRHKVNSFRVSVQAARCDFVCSGPLEAKQVGDSSGVPVLAVHGMAKNVCPFPSLLCWLHHPVVPASVRHPRTDILKPKGGKGGKVERERQRAKRKGKEREWERRKGG